MLCGFIELLYYYGLPMFSQFLVGSCKYKEYLPWSLGFTTIKSCISLSRLVSTPRLRCWKNAGWHGSGWIIFHSDDNG